MTLPVDETNVNACLFDLNLFSKESGVTSVLQKGLLVFSTQVQLLIDSAACSQG